MGKFTCVNKYYDAKDDYNNEIPRYIETSKDIINMEDTYIFLRCDITDYTNAVEEFSNIVNKEIYYYIKVRDYMRCKKPFNILNSIKNNNDHIIGLELELSEKVSNKNFLSLISFLDSVSHNLDLRYNLGTLNVFTGKQLNILKEHSSRFDYKINLNQKYSCGFEDNNERDNKLTFDQLIELNSLIDNFISIIPKGLDDLGKIYFVYNYLGERIEYDYNMSKMNFDERKELDENSLFRIFYDNTGVCSGIAPAFKLIMNKLGIECKSVMSLSHEWNVVKLDGKWYHLDLTWDLHNISNGNDLEYFLKTESFILKDKHHQFYTYYADKDSIARRPVPKSKYKKIIR